MKNFLRLSLLAILLTLLMSFALTSCSLLPIGDKTMVSFVAGGEVIEQREWDNPDLLSSPPEKEGYIIEGWYMDEGVWEQAFNSETISQMTAEEDFSVYAKVVPIEYNITYVSDVETTSSNPSTYTIEDAVTLEDLVLTGYTFDGWYDGETKVTEIPAGSTGDRTLTAKFTAKTYTITYELNNGQIGANRNPSTYDINTEIITLKKPSRAGYIFDGWYNGKTKVTSIPKGSTGDITLTAKWYSNVTLKFNANGGVGTMSDKTYAGGVKANLPLNTFTRNNYVFAGWKGSDGNTYSNAQEFIITSSDIKQLTLTAQWKPALGFDISMYQGGANLQTYKDQGIGYLILRGGYTGYGTGTNYNKDPYFETFYTQAKSLGIPVGAYWYSCANTYDKGRAEAEYMYQNCLQGKTFEYPIFIDVENSHWQATGGCVEGGYAYPGGTVSGVTEAIKGFCDYMTEKGMFPAVYTYASFLRNMDINEVNARYDIWLAAYVGSTSSEDKTWINNNYPSITYTMYQWTDAYSSSAPVDANWTYKDYEAFIKRFGLNGFSKSDKTAVYKSYTDLAQEVKNGKWGSTDEARKLALTAAGYDYQGVQEALNWLN